MPRERPKKWQKDEKKKKKKQEKRKKKKRNADLDGLTLAVISPSIKMIPVPLLDAAVSDLLSNAT